MVNTHDENRTTWKCWKPYVVASSFLIALTLLAYLTVLSSMTIAHLVHQDSTIVPCTLLALLGSECTYDDQTQFFTCVSTVELFVFNDTYNGFSSAQNTSCSLCKHNYIVGNNYTCSHCDSFLHDFCNNHTSYYFITDGTSFGDWAYPIVILVSGFFGFIGLLFTALRCALEKIRKLIMRSNYAQIDEDENPNLIQ